MTETSGPLLAPVDDLADLAPGETEKITVDDRVPLVLREPIEGPFQTLAVVIIEVERAVFHYREFSNSEFLGSCSSPLIRSAGRSQRKN